jgi:hypothetical protein
MERVKMFERVIKYFFPKEEAKAINVSETIIKKIKRDAKLANLVRLRMCIKRYTSHTTILKREIKYCRKHFLFELEKQLASQLHRAGIEQRSQFLAYAFLRGQTYEQVEENPKWIRDKCAAKPNWKYVTELVLQYGNSDYSESYAVLKDEVAEKVKKWANY